MQVDHVFIFSKNLQSAEAAGRSLGLTETYRRTHAGQGTSNICYCFENAFIEFLILDNISDANSPAISRIGLSQRAEWEQHKTCPIGIAWRLDPGETAPKFPTWQFRPPYLPEGMSIPVAVESDDPKVPMLFQSPGLLSPNNWPPERRGVLQQPAKLRRIIRWVLICPEGFVAGPALTTILAATKFMLRLEPGCGWGLSLDVEREDDSVISLEVLKPNQ